MGCNFLLVCRALPVSGRSLRVILVAHCGAGQIGRALLGISIFLPTLRSLSPLLNMSILFWLTYPLLCRQLGACSTSLANE